MYVYTLGYLCRLKYACLIPRLAFASWVHRSFQVLIHDKNDGRAYG